MSSGVEDVTEIFEKGLKMGLDSAGAGIEQVAKKGLKSVLPKPPEAPGAPDPVKPDQGEIKAAVDQQKKRLRAGRGRSSTILTSGSTLGEPLVSRKTILGG